MKKPTTFELPPASFWEGRLWHQPKAPLNFSASREKVLPLLSIWTATKDYMHNVVRCMNNKHKSFNKGYVSPKWVKACTLHSQFDPCLNMIKSKQTFIWLEFPPPCGSRAWTWLARASRTWSKSMSWQQHPSQCLQQSPPGNSLQRKFRDISSSKSSVQKHHPFLIAKLGCDWTDYRHYLILNRLLYKCTAVYII